MEFPLCADCEQAGRTTAAEEVHHKVRISLAPEKRLDFDNLLALCKSCHSKRTKRGE